MPKIIHSGAGDGGNRGIHFLWRFYTILAGVINIFTIFPLLLLGDYIHNADGLGIFFFLSGSMLAYGSLRDREEMINAASFMLIIAYIIFLPLMVQAAYIGNIHGPLQGIP